MVSALFTTFYLQQRFRPAYALGSNEPCHEKNTVLHMQKHRRSSAVHCTAAQRFCFCYTDSTTPFLLVSKILSTSSLLLCQTCWKTPKTSFLASRLKCQCLFYNFIYRLHDNGCTFFCSKHMNCFEEILNFTKC